MAVNQTAQQTDQFLLTYQLYNYFVCDKSHGLLVGTSIASWPWTAMAAVKEMAFARLENL